MRGIHPRQKRQVMWKVLACSHTTMSLILAASIIYSHQAINLARVDCWTPKNNLHYNANCKTMFSPVWNRTIWKCWPTKIGSYFFSGFNVLTQPPPSRLTWMEGSMHMGAIYLQFIKSSYTIKLICLGKVGIVKVHTISFEVKTSFNYHTEIKYIIRFSMIIQSD